MPKKFHFYRQVDMRDCGPTCLRMISRHYGKVYSRESLREKTHITKQGVTLAGIAEAAEDIGFRSLGLRVKPEVLFDKVPRPCIIPWRQKHFVVLTEVRKNQVVVADPAYGMVKYTKEEFLAGWFNELKQEASFVLALEPTAKFYDKVDSQEVEGKKAYAFLLPYFKAHKRILFQILFGLVIGLILQFTMPFLLQSVIDYGVNYQNVNFIYIILIAQLVLFLSQTAVRIIRDWLILHMTARINIKMVSDFLLKILNLPISYFETRNMGEHIQRIRDHQRINNFLSATSLATAFSLVTLIIFSAILWYYNVFIFIVFLIGSIFFIVWSLFFLKRRKLLDFKRFDKLADNDSSVVEIIEGINDIKTNNSKFKQRWRWERIQVELYALSIESLGLTQAQTIGSHVINELKNILITFIAAKSVVDGNITLGMMVSIQYIIGQLNGPLQSFITFLQNGQDAKISLDRLSEVHNKKNEIDQSQYKPDLVDKTIHFENVSFRYGGSHSPMVLKNINVSFPEGKTTAIVGASGSGKTTLIKLILKFMSPIEGQIKVGSTNLDRIHSDYWRSHCGTVLQDGFLFNDTIGSNIAESEQSGVIDRERLYHSAYTANIAEVIEKMPNGYDTVTGHGGHRLSGGQIQRLYIARAIYSDPDYLFFDEATSALDASNERVIVERLDKVSKEKTVIVIAHRLSTVKNADQIIVLDKGEVAEVGNHKKLKKKKGIYFTLVKNQLELGS